jgi:hypothetical protein
VLFQLSRSAPWLPKDRKLPEDAADSKRILREGVTELDIEAKAAAKLAGLFGHLNKMEGFMKSIPMTPEKYAEYQSYTYDGASVATPPPFALKLPMFPASYGFMIGGPRFTVDASGKVTEPVAPYKTGFPQGAPVSPFLSILLLKLLKVPKDVKLIMYADDGLLYSDREFSPSDFSSSLGDLDLSLSPDKCGWVRRDGD